MTRHDTRQGDLFALLEPAPQPIAAVLQAQLDGDRTIAVDDAFYDGPVHGSYSADTVAFKGTLRRTFRHQGIEYVSMGGLYAGLDRCGDYQKCYRLAPDDGTAPSYSAWDWDTMRGSEMGGYHGMAVKHGGQAMRLVGPEVRFVRGGAASQAALL